MKQLKLFLILVLVLFITKAQAQNDDILLNCNNALKIGSAKELAKYFNQIVELGFDGKNSNYSKTQAEFVLKDFFRQHPPVDFQYNHQGSSVEGLKYALGTYTYKGGSYSVRILIKPFNGTYLIDSLVFSKE